MTRPLTIALILAASASVAQAQLNITWSTIDGGGLSRTAAGAFALGGTTGQPDAGTITGGSLVLQGGFWPGIYRRCPADIDDGSFTGTPDGGVTIDDLLYFLFLFEQGLVAADIDDGSFTNTPDGGVTIDDLLYYLFRFENGC